MNTKLFGVMLLAGTVVLSGCTAEGNNSNTLGRKQDLTPSLEAVQLSVHDY